VGEKRLVLARAALLLLGLGLVGQGVEHLEERRSVGASRLGTAGRVGMDDGQLNVGLRAPAASRGLLLASRLLALKLALGLGAVGGLDALVVALELLAHGAALGLGRRAGGVALSRRAHSLALGAVLLLAKVLGAADRAHGAFAVHGALGAGGLLATHLTLGAGAHRVANGRAGGVIALPLALGVALGGVGSRNSQEAAHSEENATHLM
jgi:hypothetical protein